MESRNSYLINRSLIKFLVASIATMAVTNIDGVVDSVLMGVPVGVFYCASPIEYQSMHLFTSILNCGRFFKTSFKIVRWINECVTNPAILDIYKEAAQEVRRKGNGAEYIAKFIQSYNE